MIRILLVAHVRLMREQLVTALSGHPQLQLVASTGDAATAIANAVMFEPEVMLVDHALPHATHLIRQISDQCPWLRTLVIGIPEDERKIIGFAEAGMWGYTPPDASLAELTGAIERLARGESTCSRSMTTSLMRRLSARARGRTSDAFHQLPLTAREAEIAGLIDEGLSNKEIARHLGVEVATVKNHVHNLLAKLQVHRRAEAAAWVRQRMPRHTPPPGSMQRPA